MPPMPAKKKTSKQTDRQAYNINYAHTYIILMVLVTILLLLEIDGDEWMQKHSEHNAPKKLLKRE